VETISVEAWISNLETAIDSAWLRRRRDRTDREGPPLGPRRRALSKLNLAGDTRLDLGALVASGSNYHVPEVNLTEGNLLRIAVLQTGAYAKAKLKSLKGKLTKQKKRRKALRKKARRLEQEARKAPSARKKRAARRDLKRTRRQAKAAGREIKSLRKQISALERQLD